MLTLTGSDTLAHYQQVLDSVSYSRPARTRPILAPTPAARSLGGQRRHAHNSAIQTTTLNISGGPATESLFSPSATASTVPANDPSAVDLGVKFQASTNDTLIGICVYKGPNITGTHIGDLWITSGTLLAGATCSDETAKGWHHVNYSSPVSITASTTCWRLVPATNTRALLGRSDTLRLDQR